MSHQEDDFWLRRAVVLYLQTDDNMKLIVLFYKEMVGMLK